MLTKEDMVGFEYFEQYELNLEDKVTEDPRAKTPLEMVKEYQKVSKQTPDTYLYLDLIAEEYLEFVQAETTKEELKELCDLVYVIYGYANAMGWDMDQALWRIHDNNMERMFQDDGTILRRDDGKIIKNPNTKKVELGDLV